MNDYNICITGDEARMLLKILYNADIKGAQSFMAVGLIQKLNEISVAQPPRSS